MALIAIEENGDGDVRWTSDGRTTHTAPSLRALSEGLSEPHAVLCEPIFYLGLRDVRAICAETLAAGGHRLVPVSGTAKAVLEAAAGPGVTGSDVERLFAIAVAGRAGLDRHTACGHDLWAVRDALDVAHAIDTAHDPAAVLASAVGSVGPYAALEPAVRAALGDGRAYRADVLLAAYRAATVATSRVAFERFLGRSEGAHGAMAHTIRAWYVAANTTAAGFERESVLTWSQYRSALRSVFSRVKASRREEASAT